VFLLRQAKERNWWIRYLEILCEVCRLTLEVVIVLEKN
jgi:hypothetical protein